MKKLLIGIVVLVLILVIGIVSVSLSLSGPGSPLAPETHDYAVRISFSGGWSGAIGVDGNQASYDGFGSRTIDVRDDCDLAVVAVIQKGFDDTTFEAYSGTLTVSILDNGEVVESGSTSADFGVVSVSYSCF